MTSEQYNPLTGSVGAEGGESQEKKVPFKDKIIDFLKSEFASTLEGYNTHTGTPINIDSLPIEERQRILEKRSQWQAHVDADRLLTDIGGFYPEMAAFLFDDITVLSLAALKTVVDYYFPRVGAEARASWDYKQTDKGSYYIFNEKLIPLRVEQAMKVMVNPEAYTISAVPGSGENMKLLFAAKAKNEEAAEVKPVAALSEPPTVLPTIEEAPKMEYVPPAPPEKPYPGVDHYVVTDTRSSLEEPNAIVNILLVRAEYQFSYNEAPGNLFTWKDKTLKADPGTERSDKLLSGRLLEEMKAKKIQGTIVLSTGQVITVS